MIRTIEVKLNAAHPELPLPEATALVGSPSAVFISGVPRAVGAWCITSVHVAATYPDSSTHSIAAVQGADGVWVATLPATDTSGRVEAGFQIEADGIDERGDSVTGYCLGICDFAIYSRDIVPAPGPAPSWVLHYFATPPQTPRTGDVATFDGVTKFYNGSAWLTFADVPAASTATPQMAGTASAGAAAAYARGDHVHPAETAVSTTYGLPASAFPIVFQYDGETFTVQDSSEVSLEIFPDGPDEGNYGLYYTIVSEDFCIAAFGATTLRYYQSAEAYISPTDITFNGVTPVSGTTPVLESIPASVTVRGVEVALQSVVEAHTSNTTIHVTAEDKATWSGKLDVIDLPYALGTALTPDANDAIQLANHAVNLFAPTSAIDPLVIKFPASLGAGLARDCFLRVDLTDGGASLANVSFANADGTAAVVETPGGSYPTLADGTVTILYISETAAGRWLIKSETVEVAS